MSLTVGQLARIIGGRLHARDASIASVLPVGKSVSGVLANTRFASDPGAMIWDLPGNSQQQAHNESAHARAHGMPSIQGIVTINEREMREAFWQIIVPDAAKALLAFAGWRRQQFAGQLVAVTGPIGKSTTRRMIEHLATARFSAERIAAHRAMDDSSLSVPLLLANLSDQAVAIVECHTNEELRLCNPTIAVLTSHPTTAGFGHETVSAESSLAALSPRAQVVLPANVRVDDDACVSVAHIITYGREAECDVHLRHVRCGGGELSFLVDDNKIEIPVWGRHHAPAAAAAIAVARALEFSFLEIVTNLAKFSSHAAGCSVFHHANMTFINDTRHASRDSLRAALEMLQEVGAKIAGQNAGRKVVVCDSIMDIDNSSPELSRAFGEQVCCVGGADLLLADGRYAEDVVNAALAAGMTESSTRVISTSDETKQNQRTRDVAVRDKAATLQTLLRPGDTVLYKSGSSSRLSQVISKITQENNLTPLEGSDINHLAPSASFV